MALPLIEEMVTNMQSNPMIQDHFLSLADTWRLQVDKLREKGMSTKDINTVSFMPVTLSEDFRRTARQKLDEPGTKETLHKEFHALQTAMRETRIEPKPSTLAAVVRASKILRAETSQEYARQFAARIDKLNHIDSSESFPLLDEWLNSGRFQAWQVLNGRTQKENSEILDKMKQAIEQVGPAHVSSVTFRLWNELSGLIARHPALYERLIGLVRTGFGQFDELPNEEAETFLDQLIKPLDVISWVFTQSNVRAYVSDPNWTLARFVSDTAARLQGSFDIKLTYIPNEATGGEWNVTRQPKQAAS